jgi:hypothetical protein
MIAGNGSAMVYAQPDVPRSDRWPLAQLCRPESFGAGHDLIAALTAEEAVAFVAAEERPGLVRVAAGKGGARVDAEISQDGDRIGYRPLSGDPLELGGESRRSEREWLESSWDSPFPDACVQLLDQFRATRTGDLLVVGREGYDFREQFEIPEHKSGHGSLIRAHMQIPIWSSVPGLATPMRSVDLYPAMLDWLGVAVPEGLDGQPVWSPGRAATVA